MAAGLIALGVAGARQLDVNEASLIVSYAASALFVVGLPMSLAAIMPRSTARQIIHVFAVALIGGVLIAADMGLIDFPGPLGAPPASLTYAALALTAFLYALAPLGFNVARLSAASPFAAIIGAVGGAGYLALENLWGSPQGATAIAFALAIGVGAGVSIGADFAKYFAGGAEQKRAAAAGGHSAVAIAAFSLLVVGAFFAVQTFDANFGAVEWRIVWAGITASATAIIAVLITVTGTLAMTPISEQAAVDENYRRIWFSASWRPIRMALPTTTATAVIAIAGVFVIIALFEAGFSAPISLSLFFVLIWAAAAIAFVSLRTSLLIVLLLAVSAILADYTYLIFSLPIPGLAERLAGLALCAIALGHMTVSWRDASEVWRNARDVTENALSDGLRRYLFIVGAGAASLFVSAQSFGWDAGLATTAYFMITAFISLILAPAMMTAMSARIMRY